MELQVQTDIQMIFKNPFNQGVGGSLTEYGGKQNSIAEVKLPPHVRQYAPGIVIVRSVPDYKLDFVHGPDPGEYVGVAFFVFSAGRALDVDDLDTSPVNLCQIQSAVCFQQHRVIFFKQVLYQIRCVFLEQGFAARDFNEGACIIVDLTEDFGYIQEISFLVGVSGIAIITPQIAPGQADKNAWAPRVGRFPLDTVKYFVNPKRHPFIPGPVIS